MILTINDFKQNVIDSQGLVFVEFFARWCPHCQAFMPEWDKISQELSDQAAFYQVEIDDSPDLTQAYGVQDIPTIMVFDNGQKVEQFVGAQPKSVFEQVIQQYA